MPPWRRFWVCPPHSKHSSDFPQALVVLGFTRRKGNCLSSANEPTANDFRSAVGPSSGLPAGGCSASLCDWKIPVCPIVGQWGSEVAGAAARAGRKDMFYQSESLLFEFLVRSLISSKNQHGEVNNDSGFILVHFFFFPFII